MLGGVSGLEFQASVLISAEIAEDFDGRELYRFADFPGVSLLFAAGVQVVRYRPGRS